MNQTTNHFTRHVELINFSIILEQHRKEPLRHFDNVHVFYDHKCNNH